MKAKERKEITEEMGLQKEWYARADKITPEELPEFIRELQEDYHHDYGTICHAIAAVGVASMKAFDRGPNGGITGFQAGAIMWQVINQWGTLQEGPKRIIQYRHLLWPQYADDFDGSISQDTLDWAIAEAKKELADPKSKGWHPDVVQHLQSLADGKVPFGLRVKKER